MLPSHVAKSWGVAKSCCQVTLPSHVAKSRCQVTLPSHVDKSIGGVTSRGQHCQIMLPSHCSPVSTIIIDAWQSLACVCMRIPLPREVILRAVQPDSGRVAHDQRWRPVGGGMDNETETCISSPTLGYAMTFASRCLPMCGDLSLPLSLGRGTMDVWNLPGRNMCSLGVSSSSTWLSASSGDRFLTMRVRSTSSFFSIEVSAHSFWSHACPCVQIRQVLNCSTTPMRMQ